MAPHDAQKIFWQPANRDSPEPALYHNGIIFITRGEFDLAFRAEPTDKLIPIGNSVPPVCM